jgi:hypothetical protein
MIAVLLSSARIATGRLQMTARVGADPDIDPRGRDRERANAVEPGASGDASPAFVQIHEAAPTATPRDTRHGVGYMDKPFQTGGFAGTKGDTGSLAGNVSSSASSWLSLSWRLRAWRSAPVSGLPRSGLPGGQGSLRSC